MTPRYQRLDRGIYRDTRTGNLYERPRVGGKYTWRKLAATTLPKARLELHARRTRQAESRLGITLDPYAPATTVRILAQDWRAVGCLDRHSRPLTSRSHTTAQAHLRHLVEFLGEKDARTLTVEDCREYHTWRIPRLQRKGFTGGRTVDLELTTLSNLLEWASQRPRATGLIGNPVRRRPRFVNQVRHCTAVAPQTDEEIHTLAALLLSSEQSAPLGWQLLLEALTGCRTPREAIMFDCRRISFFPVESPHFAPAALFHSSRASFILLQESLTANRMPIL